MVFWDSTNGTGDTEEGIKIAKEQEKTLEEQTGIEIHIWQQQKIEQESQDYVAEVLAEVKKSRDEKNE